ncbi:MAG: branched-chain amino acid ABC transporter permease [Parcubacteria group bacterium]|nr:branched-chain amino acid ABC transporter permease [Parcubacteria group bacterium]
MEYVIHLSIVSGIVAILGMSLNLIVGYTGLLSVAHAAFYGIGAYVTAILLAGFGVNFFLALLLGMALAAAVALLIGLVLSRFDDDYYVLASLGLNIIIYSVFLNWNTLTRGPLGIPGISRPELGIGGYRFGLTSNFSFLVLTLLCAVLVYLAARFITRSSFGRVLMAIREDEQALQVFGYRTVYYKLAIFVIGAVMAAVAGALFASYITFIDPTSFMLRESIFMLSVIILGGLANTNGAVAGAVILVVLPELLRFVGLPSNIAAQMRLLLYGLALVLLMIYRPQGLFGKYRL